MIGVKKASQTELRLMQSVRDLEDDNAELHAELGVKDGEVRVLCERIDEKDARIAALEAQLAARGKLISDAEAYAPCGHTDLVAVCNACTIERLRAQLAAALARAEEAERDRDLFDWLLKFHGNTREFIADLRDKHARLMGFEPAKGEEG